METLGATGVLGIGTAGWQGGKSNRGNAHDLEALARSFDMVEIQQSFYGPLKPELARLWARKVGANPNFRFTARLDRRFTHDRLLDAAEVKRFCEGLEPIHRAGRLGCLVMQFPWAFRFTAENRAHVIQLRREFHRFPLVAEMRHASWMRDEAVGTLIDYKIGFCNADLPPFVKAMPPTSILTSAIGYVRLHGRKANDWYAEFGDGTLHSAVGGRGRPAYLYSPAELSEWREHIERVRRFSAATYVVFSNVAQGHSLINAQQLRDMMRSGQYQAAA